MRKYLIGILIGAALTVSTSVFAEDVISLIGQKIQGEFPVKINGETLEKPAIVINGTSYLPNRAIADALGMEIKFDADLGIELTNKEVAMTTPESTLSQTDELTVTEPTYTTDFIESRIISIQVMIKSYKYSIETNKGDEYLQGYKDDLKQFEDQLSIWEARKAALTQ